MPVSLKIIRGKLPFKTRLWIYFGLWFCIGVAFALAVQFAPGEGLSANEPAWWPKLTEAIEAIVSAPLEIALGLAYAFPRGILFIPAVLYLILHPVLSLTIRSKSIFLLLCIIQVVVAGIAIAGLVEHVPGT